jgi:hypothetical protein
MLKMRGLVGKKAQSHIEMILSFVIFTGFLFVIFVVLRPLKNLDKDYNNLEEIRKTIIDNVSREFSSVSLILNSEAIKDLKDKGKGCFEIQQRIDIASTDNILVKDLSENSLKSKIEPEKISIEPKDNQNRYFKIYISSYFNEESLTDNNCYSLENEDFTYGPMQKKTIPFMEEIKIINDAYMQDYNQLKKSLKLKYDFDFYIITKSRETILNDTLSKHRLFQDDVFIKEVPLTIINKSADSNEYILGLRTW